MILKVAPAISTGNAIIYKPSEIAPITSVMIAEIFKYCGLLDGVLNVVNGDKETGEILCSNNLIAKVSFTGGNKTGKIVYKIYYNKIIRFLKFVQKVLNV